MDTAAKTLIPIPIKINLKSNDQFLPPLPHSPTYPSLLTFYRKSVLLLRMPLPSPSILVIITCL